MEWGCLEECTRLKALLTLIMVAAGLEGHCEGAVPPHSALHPLQQAAGNDLSNGERDGEREGGGGSGARSMLAHGCPLVLTPGANAANAALLPQLLLGVSCEQK